MQIKLFCLFLFWQNCYLVSRTEARRKSILHYWGISCSYLAYLHFILQMKQLKYMRIWPMI